MELINEDLVDEVKEDWLESVFGTESKMSRAMFLEKMQAEENRWILDAELVRRRIKRHLRARGKGVDFLDKMADTPPKTRP